MNIKFSCPFCRNEMTVDSTRCGQRGKCPRCNNILTVPMQSESDMIFFDGNEFFDNEHLNTLFTIFLYKNANRIISQETDRKDERIYLDIKILDGRHQNVSMFTKKSKRGEEWLMAFSVIGIISDVKMLIEATEKRELWSLPTFSLNWDKEHMLIHLNCSSRLKNIDDEEFYYMTIRLAEEADKLQKQVLQVDDVPWDKL